MDFYYFSLCHVCKKPSSDLKKCSCCKVLHYCSREHQLRDWPKHKEICKVITKTNKILISPVGASAEDFNHFKYSSALLWHCGAGRPLNLAEHHMWMFPKVCAICYSQEVTIICENCLSVAYCSQEHQESHRESHKKSCNGLKLCLLIHQTLATGEIPTNWINFKIKKDAKSLPGNVQDTMKLMGWQAEPNFSKKYIDYVITTEFFSPVINMIYALEKSGFIENRRAKKSKLVVHVVGPDISEASMCWPIIMEFFSHWIFNLKSVSVFMIGPEIHNIETQVNLSFNCETCMAKHFFASIAGIESYYHNLVQLIAKPDLVVAFNSGLHEFNNNVNDTWKESIPKLICYRGVPALLTAYTETELQKDIARFPESRRKFLVEPQRNPYANLRPIRNWEEGGEPIFYQNNYVAIITKK